MNAPTWTRRVAAPIVGLTVVLAVGAVPAQADDPSSPCSDATVVRTPQSAVVLADGDSGGKRPV
ncbi:hypothetical protein [Nonomuraea zeae]|uniref:Uncharacterized protein n=1 Tax=Nonomuraea zeae TaxID=1642303 RepID=A0A5S4GMT5_9ACTN|nr:hypothetical protein [Nonomuraea zeae]TMR33891.1 hypothetical protein ETD85_18615 [Nonomuraea zeae]